MKVCDVFLFGSGHNFPFSRESIHLIFRTKPILAKTLTSGACGKAF